MGSMVSKELMEKIENGEYSEILRFIQKDDTLEWRFKGDAAAIYYRGLMLADLYCDRVVINRAFTKDGLGEVRFEVSKEWKLLDAIPYLKQNADFKFTNSSGTYENEFSQMIARENNSGDFGNKSDYFILENEYVFDFSDTSTGGGRIDLVGVCIDHDRKNRKVQAIENSKYGIVLIETKYLESAYNDSNATPGIPKHVSDFSRLFDLANRDVLDDMARDLENIFSAKRRLGLFPGLKGDISTIGISADPMDMRLVLALIGRNTHTDNLIKILQDLIKSYPQEITDRVLIAGTSEIGFGLYDDRMVTIKDYIA